MSAFISATLSTRPRAGKDVGGIDEAFLTATREMYSHAGTARTAEVPAGLIKPRRLGQVGRLGHLPAVGEGDRLAPGTRETEPDLAAGLEVEDEVVEGALAAAGDQLGDGRQLARAHPRLDVGPRAHRGLALAPAELGEQDVALRAQAVELLLQRPHAVTQGGHPRLQLAGLEGGQVVAHR